MSKGFYTLVGKESDGNMSICNPYTGVSPEFFYKVELDDVEDFEKEFESDEPLYFDLYQTFGDLYWCIKEELEYDHHYVYAALFIEGKHFELIATRANKENSEWFIDDLRIDHCWDPPEDLTISQREKMRAQLSLWMEELVQMLKNMGVERLTLTANGERAQKLWKRYGFMNSPVKENDNFMVLSLQ